MQSTIFYSWQSDLANKINRGFIEDALEKAIKQVSNDLIVQEAMREESLKLDKDTKNVPGTPPIVEVIFNKISSCSVFVPDITFIAKSENGRLTPNPNVLIEYGWALKELGHSRIVPVMNTAFGEPTGENLPFDMRHLRRPVTYHLPDGLDEYDRAKIKAGLVQDISKHLELIIKAGLLDSQISEVESSPETPATWSLSVFWDRNEPFAATPGMDGALKPINVMDCEHAFLRIIPSTPIAPISPTGGVELVRRGQLHPMTDRLFGLSVGRNRYGAYVYTSANNEDPILCVTELLKSGELWGSMLIAFRRKPIWNMQRSRSDLSPVRTLNLYSQQPCRIT